MTAQVSRPELGGEGLGREGIIPITSATYIPRPPEEPALLSEAITRSRAMGWCSTKSPLRRTLPTAEDLRELLQLTDQPTPRVQF